MNNFQFLIFNFQKSKKGQAALPAIILVSAIVLTIGLAIVSLGLAEHNIAYNNRLSSRAFDLAETCAEDANLKIARDPNFSGNYNLQISGNQCNIVIETNLTTKKIIASAQVQQVWRTIEATFSVEENGELNLVSWKEI
jgi:Tfp pilus assembly protein PilX